MYFPLSATAFPFFGVIVIAYVPVSTARSPLIIMSVTFPFTSLRVFPPNRTLQECRNCGFPLQHRRTRAKYERVVRIVGQNGCGVSARHGLPNPDSGGLDLSPCFGLV